MTLAPSRIGLVTTLGTNIGDDLIRAGIVTLLEEAWPGIRPHTVAVNKHRPFSAYRSWHPLRWAPCGRRTLQRWIASWGGTVFDDCDLIIQCGAPVLWPGCHQSEWAEPLWEHVLGRLSSQIPVLDLAAGSCYPWERRPERIEDPGDAAFLRRILSCCRVTTARDTLAARLFMTLGTETPLLPCTASLALPAPAAAASEDGWVLLNIMEGAGHYDWEQGIVAATWRETVLRLIERLRSRHRLAFLCHDVREEELARRLDASLPAFRPPAPEEYARLAHETKMALCNRLHASVALAGAGIPSVAVGTDTRMLMVKEFSLPCLYVKETTAEVLEDHIEDLDRRRHAERDRLLELVRSTRRAYLEILRSMPR